ncbi:MAG TPA: hypothetical protein VK870_07075 [Ignavibacteriaceae bacterium]|nr:hypothetical protein [Ignavibacteriaceae bacterium]
MDLIVRIIGWELIIQNRVKTVVKVSIGEDIIDIPPDKFNVKYERLLILF